MVSKKVAKKSAARKSTAKKPDKAVPKKVASKKAAAKRSPPRRGPKSLDLNQAIVAEARAILARKSTGEPLSDAEKTTKILKILANIAEEIHELIVLLSTRGWP